jgi:predicted membrane channel-forming protein YqfA (hemolysin III family)
MVTLIFYIALIGIIVGALTTLVPMADPFKKLIYILGGLLCLILLARIFGVNLDLPHSIR